MWSAPAKNMKKINMSISFVYSVSIQGNCENAVFTFLLFSKQIWLKSFERCSCHIRQGKN